MNLSLNKYSSSRFLWLISRLTMISLLLTLSGNFLHAQTPSLILIEDHFSVCEGETAIVELTITGFPEVWCRIIHNNDTASYASPDNTFRLRLDDPGLYVIYTYGDDNTPVINPVDSFYIEQFPAPQVYFSGGGVNCSEGNLEPLVVHFTGEPDFRFRFLFNGVLDSLETRRTDITFPTDQSFEIEAVNLQDNNCQLEVDASANYRYIDVPEPVILGDTLVCKNETRLYRPADDNYRISWNLPQGIEFTEGSDGEGVYLSVDWDSTGIYPLLLNYEEDVYGCQTDWASLIIQVAGSSQANDLDTTTCFELAEVMEVLLETEEGELVYWPELNEEGNHIYLYETGRFTHIHTNANGCADTAVLNLISNCEPQLHVPEAFTPNNGDNLNDELILFGLFSELDFSIYSPGGVLLFHTTEDPLVFWDGTYEGNDMPPGSYFWAAVYSEGDSEVVEASGVVTIIK